MSLSLDWPGLMHAGMVGLRLLPEDFWKLSPAELALMLGDPAGAKPMNRTALDELRQIWPDRPKEDSNG